MEERSYFAAKGGQGVTTLTVADAAVEDAAGRQVWLVTHDLADTCAASGIAPPGDHDFFLPGPANRTSVMTPATYERAKGFLVGEPLSYNELKALATGTLPRSPPYSAEIARSVDAGLLPHRVPTSLQRALGRTRPAPSLGLELA